VHESRGPRICSWQPSASKSRTRRPARSRGDRPTTSSHAKLGGAWCSFADRSQFLVAPAGRRPLCKIGARRGIHLTQVRAVGNRGAGALARSEAPASVPKNGTRRPARSRGTAPPSRFRGNYLGQVDTRIHAKLGRARCSFADRGTLGGAHLCKIVHELRKFARCTEPRETLSAKW
jgi:hypothetical protein